MAGIAQQKRPALAKMLGNAVMDVIGREPVDLGDVDFQLFDHARADVSESKALALMQAHVTDRADQPSAPGSRQRKDGQEIGFVQIDMQFAIDGRAAPLDIGDIENVVIGAAGKADPESLANGRTGAIATSKIAGLTGFLAAIGFAQPGRDPCSIIAERQQFGLAFDHDTEGAQPFDQQPLMLVLREYLQKGIAGQTGADSAEVNTCRPLTLCPQIDRRHLVPLRHDSIGKVKLTVKLQRARLYRQRARVRPRPGRPVDDADADTDPAEPQRQDQPGRAAPMIRTSGAFCASLPKREQSGAGCGRKPRCQLGI